MRLSVTPLGASGQSVGGVARAVVDYLEGEPAKRGVPLLSSPTGSVGSYYADSIEGPGKWLGAGAAFRSLNGVVERDAFQRVLEGRHPTTGERLVTARGSSQRSHLAVGTAAQLDVNGQAMYTRADAAKLLGLLRKDVDELVRSGLDGQGDHDDLGWIGSTTDRAGLMLIHDREITRHLDVAAIPVDPGSVRRSGPGDEELSAVECARLSRVSARYIRRISTDAPAGDSNRAAVRCRIDDTGHYWIRRDDLADFAERRKPAIARVGFDLTLTAEKSIGVLTMLSTGDRQQRLVKALEHANGTAIDHLDRRASRARRRGQQVGSEGLTVASYLHGTSRSLDPHPHHHNIVANAVVDEVGEVRTLDARGLYRNAPAAAALATAAFRWETRDLGLGWWRRDDGIWEVAGISSDAIREFSSRHSDIDEVRKALQDRLGRDITPEERNQVALITRSAKQAVDPNDLRKDWLTRADRVGLDIESCFDRADRAIAHEALPDDLRGRLFADLVDPAGTASVNRADPIRWCTAATENDASSTRSLNNCVSTTAPSTPSITSSWPMADDCVSATRSLPATATARSTQLTTDPDG
ncbi:MAG: MobF family relaxase [Ilumatobacter sp.]|uniref:MobF family relaxase n=1 Tax=Ilumatobacter sp. TaxID=1967498 RepID=UPI0032996819